VQLNYQPVETIIALGADRVGKTTSVSNTRKLIEGYGSNVVQAHFGPVSEKDHYPGQQFADFIYGIDNIGTDFLLLDRFVSDTLFYEPRRNGFPRIPYEYANHIESMFLEVSERLDLVVIRHEWNMDIEKRHLAEISQLYPNRTAYWESINLKAREAEHRAYYEFLENYLTSHSLLPQTSIHYLDGELYGDDISLSYCEGLQLP
jgi:hypothetical protein